MDDQLIDRVAGDEMLRRLEAYAETRLSPDLTASSRLRARVLAVAHRHAALARADAALTVLSRPEGISGADAMPGLAVGGTRAPARRRRGRWQRAAGVVLAASLGTGLAVGGAVAARPGAPLYDTRLWAETLALPRDPSARAVAELGRLGERLQEIAEASRSGDAAGATAALTAYEDIVVQASVSAILAGDEVAAAVLETGVGRNVAVLQALAAKVPANASGAIGRAVEAAIARSADAIDRIGASRPGGGPGDGAGSGPPGTDGGAKPHATKSPTSEPTPASGSTATPKPKPTHKATPEPTATPEVTATPEHTPKPREQQGVPKPSDSPQPTPGEDPEGDGN